MVNVNTKDNTGYSSNTSLKYNGKDVLKDRYQNKYIIDDNGKKVYINDLFGINQNIQETQEKKEQKVISDINQIKNKHEEYKEHWNELLNQALENGKLAFKNLKINQENLYTLLRDKNCKSVKELKAGDLKLGKKYLSSISDAQSAKWRSTTDSIFYSNLAVSEILRIQDYNNLESLAKTMFNNA